LFFQAEDGIRDFHVTGVQTCALPILYSIESVMNELVQQHLKTAKESMQKAVAHTESELAKIRAGKAMPSMLDGVQVDYYGSMMPLNQVSNVNTPDPRTITVQPWEKSMLQPIEKAIMDANLGF